MITEGKGCHAPEPVEWNLSPHESYLCAQAALTVSEFRSYAGRGGWQGGLMGDGFSVPGVGWMRSDVAPRYIGNCAEAAVIGILNKRLSIQLSLDDRLRGGGDGGVDLKASTLTMQIKCRRSGTAHALSRISLVRYATDRGFVVFPKTMAIVFCESTIETRKVKILGWIYTKLASELPVVAARRGNHTNIEIPDTKLEPISALIDNIRTRMEYYA